MGTQRIRINGETMRMGPKKGHCCWATFAFICLQQPLYCATIISISFARAHSIGQRPSSSSPPPDDHHHSLVDRRSIVSRELRQPATHQPIGVVRSSSEPVGNSELDAVQWHLFMSCLSSNLSRLRCPTAAFSSRPLSSGQNDGKLDLTGW